jgi:hypothetical protein
MPWLPTTPPRTDEEIAAYVTAEVEAGRVPLERAQALERLLRDEADGKCVVMRDPKIRPKPPRKPSWEF